MHLMLCKNRFLHHILFCWTFSKGKCSAVQKCIWCVHFVGAKMHFCKTKCYKCILAYIFQRKMFSCAKMHLMQKCIFAYIFLWKMFSITFDFVKCSASHFPKENVQHHIWLCKMFSITFDFVKCSASHFPKENVQQRNHEFSLNKYT